MPKPHLVILPIYMWSNILNTIILKLGHHLRMLVVRLTINMELEPRNPVALAGFVIRLKTPCFIQKHDISSVLGA